MPAVREQLRLWTAALRAAPIVSYERSKFTQVVQAAPHPIRYAQVGCGDIGSINAGALQRCRHSRLVAAYDVDARLARELAGRFGARAANGYAELLADPEIDAVVISTPHDTHVSLGLEALAAGKHVVLEKPMALDAAGCERLIAAEKASRGRITVCFPERYALRTYRTKELLRAGAIGRAFQIRIRLDLSRGAQYWRGGISGRSVNDWRRQRDRAGGGVLIMNAIHAIETVRWLFDSDPSDLRALACNGDPASKDVEDNAVVAFRLGETLGILAASTRWPTARSRSGIEIVGEEGIIEIGDDLCLALRRPFPPFPAGRAHRIMERPPCDERTAFFDECSRALSKGSAPDITSRDGLRLQRLLEDAYRSAGY